ncbi:hypothetical protein SAY87_013554 [Trapa incisa]|uniref:ABC transporter domain-containing protein n=1 Tax=Trapa incisa TaxID=236973 RepID=A0AAN7QD36_9MYRT|nr:hypothetical protein SAY87_013554 [Trapa incisa]
MDEYFEYEIESGAESLVQPSNAGSLADDENELRWAAIERLPSAKRMNMALMRRSASEQAGGKPQDETIHVRKLDRSNRELVVKKALATTDQDNYKLLSAIKERLDQVGLEVPKVEIRFQNLNIAAYVQTGSRALPTLWNYSRDMIESILTIFRPRRHSLTILNDASGVIKPGSQTDNHIGELTVRETFDFAARYQGASEGFGEYIKDLTRLEKERNIHPSPEIDAFMKASSVGDRKHSISTDYVLKVLCFDVCADTIVGSDMMRGVSGGQRKRVTTGEMIVGPRKILFMDEISTGLDSSTTYQIVKCVRNFVHFMDATVLMALLQPAPETFDLFDDLVTSIKDQAQYWADSSKPYEFIPVSAIAEAFKSSRFGKSVQSTLSNTYDKSKSHPTALSKTRYAVSRMELFKTSFTQELLLISRHRFLYTFRTFQVAFFGFVTCTIFLRTRIHPTDETNGNLYLSCLFFRLVHMMFNGFSELPIMISRLPVFYKQRDNLFHPAWTWSISSWILRVPYSIIEAVVWSCVVYYTVGFAPAPGRFFRFMFILVAVHQMALGLFRMMAALARDMVIANTFGSAALLIIFLLGGFIIPKSAIKPWWIWAFWISPLSYAQRAVSVNEFTATRWMKKSALGNHSIGDNVLQSHGLPNEDYWYWLSLGALIAYALLFNNLVTLALSYLNPLRKAQNVVPADATEQNSSANAG